MNQSNKCPECGAELPDSAPRGHCPACLLKRGLETNTVGFTAEEPPPARWASPTIEELSSRFPELEISRLIGRGGMGAVYQARQKNLDRVVALKILPSEMGHDAAFAERFAREAQAMAKLNHPHIVTIHEFGQRGGWYFFVMEYVDGMNLRGLLDTGHISPKEALAIVPQICEALQYAHEQGIVHRDIKPENILLNKQGQVKIADFGLAKLIGRPPLPPGERQGEGVPGSRETSTLVNQVLGTPQYMAPEQLDRPAEVDHRADIYSLGVVFYQMLTGELPKGKFEPPSRKVVIDVRLDEVVLRALEKEPAKRYQQVSEVKTEVETIVSTPGAVNSTGVPAAPAQVQQEGFWQSLKAGKPEAEWEGRAPGWRIRCRTCGFTEHFGKYGIRMAAAGTKWTLGRCERCGRIRIHVIEKGSVPVEYTPPVSATGPVQPPRFSRTAIVGVVWAVFAVLALLQTFLESTGAVLPAGSAPPGDGKWLWVLLRISPVLGYTAPFGTTILGWIAVSQIRRSKGQLYGLGLAVFDGLLFPLLILDALIPATWHQVFFVLLKPGPLSGLWMFVGVVNFCIVIDYLIVRRVWRAANKPLPGQPSTERPSDPHSALRRKEQNQVAETRPGDGAYSRFALGLLLLALLATPLGLAGLHRDELVLAFGGVALALAIVFGLISRRQRLGRNVVWTALAILAVLGIAALGLAYEGGLSRLLSRRDDQQLVQEKARQSEILQNQYQGLKGAFPKGPKTPDGKADVIPLAEEMARSATRPTAVNADPRAAVGMLAPLQGIYVAVRTALFDQNDPKTAIALLDQAIPQMEKFLEMLKGTDAEPGIGTAIQQVRGVRQALKEGKISQAKALLEGINKAGPMLEELVRKSAATKTGVVRPPRSPRRLVRRQSRRDRIGRTSSNMHMLSMAGRIRIVLCRHTHKMSEVFGSRL